MLPDVEPNEPPEDAQPSTEPAGPLSRRRPPYRRLRVFAFDPLLGNQLDTLVINRVTLPVVWEEDLQRGPIGEYLEVVDCDPASECWYAPVDLNHPHLLASDGLVPSEGNPQFHQQMVYAVAMTTIRHFEKALGRKALWAPRSFDETESGEDEFVGRLRIYPHALREANAYYSPEKKSLLFGYFPALGDASGRNLPGGMVFACLSHDIIAHETTHALLDGLHGRFIEPSNPDVLAFHEAFADIVALFQHFTFPDVLRHQIAQTRGNLADQNLLGKLAQQFGEAIGNYGALRDAIGQVDRATGEWKSLPPDPTAIHRTTEPHARGSILVAAVFDAFLAIYKRRIADLLRIATGGSGVLPAGELHPDLVDRLAREASKSADHVLTMCIRALDYCPPVDLTFGEYLRALITADAELVHDDDLGYRVAMTEAFRRRGIYPPGVRSLAADSLVWEGAAELLGDPRPLSSLTEKVKELSRELDEWDLSTDRERVFRRAMRVRRSLHDWLAEAVDSENAAALGRLAGLSLSHPGPGSVTRSPDGRPAFEVHGAWPARRVGPDGQLQQHFVVAITQKRAGYRDAAAQADADAGRTSGAGDFTFRGGCTLVFDLDSAELRYVVRKDLLAENRLRQQREFLANPASASLRATYFGAGHSAEPFAALHRSY